MHKKSKRQIDKPFESNLRALWREFKRCSEMYRPLYSDQLLFGKPLPEQSLVEFYDTQQPDEVADTRQPDEVADAHEPDEAVNELVWDHLDMPLPVQSWLAFTETHQPDEAANEWWVWERVPFGKQIHRYSGCADGLVEFRKLAESAAILFEEMEIFKKAGSHHSWTDFLHFMAQHYQMPLLRAKQLLPVGLGLYEVRSKALRLRPPNLVAPEELAERWSRPVFGNTPNYPRNWTTQCLIHSVFTSSMTLIEAILDPDSVVYISFLTDRSSMDDILGPPEVTPDEEATVISPQRPIPFPPDKNVFKRISEKVWAVEFVEGGIEPEQGIVIEKCGFYHIQKLLSSEKQPVSYLDLYAAIPVRGLDLSDVHESRSVTREVEHSEESHGHNRGGTDSDEMVTRQMITEMRKTRKELLAKIDRATSDGNEVELVKHQSALVNTEKFLNSVSNLWGYPRKFPVKSPASLAFNCVNKNISIAMASLKKYEKLHAFLKFSLQRQEEHGWQYLKAGEVKWDTT